MRPLLNERGQFIPISMMMIFTIVIFMIAVVNIYTVARAKLQMQNIADAAALNLASQHAQAYNLISDKNEWLNHMTAGVPSPNDEQDTSNANCEYHHGVHGQRKPVPGVGCLENTFGRLGKKLGDMDASDPVFRRHIFPSRDGAIYVGMTIHTVNEAQKLFIEAYNSFIGYSPQAQASGAAPRNFTDLLKQDIPELGDGSVQMIAWNSASNEGKAQEQMKNWQENPVEGGVPKSIMSPLQFKVHHDIMVRFEVSGRLEGRTLGELLFGEVPWGGGGSRYPKKGPYYGQPYEAVGWLVPGSETGTGEPRMSNNMVGVGVIVVKTVAMPFFGATTVTAESRAYVMPGGKSDPFHPTYWVKLGTR